jgi:hypothetical protein
MADTEAAPQLKSDAIGLVDALVNGLAATTPHRLLHLSSRPVLCVPVSG